MNRTDIINSLIEKYDCHSYLEIGLSAGANFVGVKCLNKKSIDPDPRWSADYVMTSDEYFYEFRDVFKYDIVFIDGLHEADQVLKDFENAKRVAHADVIVFHDCNPQSKEAQMVPRIQKQWNGDVWKAWAFITASYPSSFCVDTDEGVGIWVRGNELNFVDWDHYRDLTYDYLRRQRKKLLNLKPVSYFEKWIS